MRSGRVYDFDEKAPQQEVDLCDLLQSVSTERRFFNQIPWTVLQHSVAMGLATTNRCGGNRLMVQHAFCHDLHEAFCRDVPSFLKNDATREHELAIKQKVHRGLGLPPLSQEDAPILKQIDEHMALVEALEFYPHNAMYFTVLENLTYPLDPVLMVNIAHQLRTVRQELSLTDDAGDITPDCVQIFRNVLARS